MEKCCTANSVLKNQRRINGWELPLSFQQVISWFVLITTATINLGINCQIQFDGLKIVTLIIFVCLYVTHIAYHIAAVTIDPAEKDLRNRDTSEVPEFDRNLHAHVIENGRCHLCNIYTSNKKTKHCGLCNKCVYGFDHHCKWLNNCIGERNYFAFIGCVITALLISILTSVLCFADILLFFEQPTLLSSAAQNFINCSSTNITCNIKYCQNSISFLTFLVIFCVSGIAITFTLLHLYCFHFYIALLGQSTYEYIVRKRNTETENKKCCVKMPFFNRIEVKKETPHNLRKSHCVVPESERKQNVVNKNDTNLINLLNVVANSEINKAKKMFSSYENKVHPHQGSHTAS